MSRGAHTRRTTGPRPADFTRPNCACKALAEGDDVDDCEQEVLGIPHGEITGQGHHSWVIFFPWARMSISTGIGTKTSIRDRRAVSIGVDGSTCGTTGRGGRRGRRLFAIDSSQTMSYIKPGSARWMDRGVLDSEVSS
ncbi:hypothetical protein TREMEDRAFT_66473 [Tremella mesenterica DSM 1558]|uniref:uncharacterized protein n=1 Tax=Tremella mesenterica (strain ATCC 24925 / CBS 8224 / DSM 1558 / NBRC 9311 / NRRL Y-6157 / RJB 2259-6 / UBC 559-6) TaxID=578456 RepID=UPI00032BE20B|nr:uncharacterized protein TREMEDRAFT_66473 [Tremella mesenterica DSM 1558]EIW65559.1 hypothetical protein TREMEDRAFT_66473 [Tremella mesenterica DSM 1558]